MFANRYALTRRAHGATKVKDLECIIQVIENDTTHFHFARVESQSASAGTVAVSYKSVAFADVASGPSASDTVDQLVAVIFYRMID